MTVKTTISLPEELFALMEREVAASGTGRSRFVAQLVEQYFREKESDATRRALDEIYSGAPDPEDVELHAFLQRAARQTLRKG